VACQSQLPASDPNSHATAPPATAQELEQLRTYAVCMRAHGIDMADPTPDGNMILGGRLAHATQAQVSNDPGYKAAFAACKDKAGGWFNIGKNR
jgi:hypothetical protein